MRQHDDLCFRNKRVNFANPNNNEHIRKLTISIVQELEIQDCTVSCIKTVQQLLPATLVLETVSKEDVGMMQWRIIVLGKFLQANNIGISRSIGLPARVSNESTANPKGNDGINNMI